MISCDIISLLERDIKDEHMIRVWGRWTCERDAVIWRRLDVCSPSACSREASPSRCFFVAEIATELRV